MDYFTIAIWVVFGMLIFMVIGGVVGQAAKGRPWDGALLGFLLGIIGVGLILIFDDHRRLCPACKNSVHPQATKCGRCGTSLA